MASERCNMKSLPIRLIISMLDDDDGVSEETWNELCFWLNAQYGSDVTAVLHGAVNATDGRLYLKGGTQVKVEHALNDLVRKAMLTEEH